ncbi:hypothetical protein B0O99DRAFT_702040 [Bisporella sp. PMI_857]|nr:hypothetical protein B0O99DRAFT_702040 [Bisporella sp. PMI_857]
MVAFLTGYYKGYRSSSNIKIIHRYLPREVGELLVYYLWLVLLFHEKLQWESRGRRCNSPFLWGDTTKVEHRCWTGPRKYREAGEEAKDEDPNHRWTSEALRAIMANASPILIVMGTGAGKSLLFQLPARSQRSGTTVVVVPLKTLERDLHERC